MNTGTVVLLVCLSVSVDCLFNVGRTQSVAVSGKLVCNGAAASSGVKLKLYDVGTVEDTLMDQGTPNTDGTFYVEGDHSDITSLSPKLNIYHKCNYNGLCYKKLQINIPSSYIASGSKPSQTYDIGTLNLANQVVGETTDCIN